MTQTKAAKAKRKRSWPNVYTRVHGSGQASYVVDIGLINGKRERHSFKTKAEAGTFAELKRIERQNQGAAALAMPQAIALAIDTAGEAYIATTTAGALPFPTTPGAYQPAPPSYPYGSGVVAKLNASGSATKKLRFM